jgi:competence protein ComEA
VPEPNEPPPRGEDPRRSAPMPHDPGRGDPVVHDPAFWGEARARRVGMPPRPHAKNLFEALWDRLGDWRSDARFGVAVVVVVAVVAGVLWYQIGVSGGESELAPTTRTTSAPAARRSPATTAPAASDGLVVHVAGAVARPGVVELPRGARVIDAIESAGGGLPDANLDLLNLAAKLADGERVLVQRVGEPGGAPTVDGGAVGEVPTTGLVNLNSATQAQLEELPGIGPVLASSIIEERDRRSGFRSVNELRDVRGIGEKRFADLRERVTV